MPLLDLATIRQRDNEGGARPVRARVDALDDLRQFGLDAVVLEHDAQQLVALALAHLQRPILQIAVAHLEHVRRPLAGQVVQVHGVLQFFTACVPYCIPHGLVGIEVTRHFLILAHAPAWVLSLGVAPFPCHIEHMRQQRDFAVGADLGAARVAVAGNVLRRDGVDRRAVEDWAQLAQRAGVFTLRTWCLAWQDVADVLRKHVFHERGVGWHGLAFVFCPQALGLDQIRAQRVFLSVPGIVPAVVVVAGPCFARFQLAHAAQHARWKFVASALRSHCFLSINVLWTGLAPRPACSPGWRD